ARATDRRAARMLFIAYERYWRDASRCIVGCASRRHLRLNRTPSHWPTRRWSHRLATSCRMQPLLFARMPDLFSLHEGSGRAGSCQCCIVDSEQTIRRISNLKSNTANLTLAGMTYEIAELSIGVLRRK